MAVVELKSDLYRDPSTLGAIPDSKFTNGRYWTMTGTVTNASDDSTGSTYLICELPSDCLLHEDTVFDVENFGFAQIRIGTLDDNDALVSAAKSAATSQSPKAFGDANHGKELWEMLGLSEDPGGVIGLYAHAVGNATADGAMPFRVAYLHN